MIAIIDYNVGNVKSVLNACERMGVKAELAKSISHADAVILPGVGSFGAAMNNLKELGIIEPLQNYKKPILGICLGMQILFEKGFECGEFDGLGLLKGNVDLIPTTAKLPHMGWNTLVKNGSDVYFAHSYMAEFNKTTLDYCEYGSIRIPAIVGRDHIMGCQFHPEKSGRAGEKILREWMIKWGL